MPLTLDDLRRFTVARTLFPPTTLRRAVHRMGFVQADPIRAPARAQDLTLRHRVRGYRAGDLERRFGELGIEEDFFVTYGFVTAEIQALMHPRSEVGVPADAPLPWPAARRKKAALLLDFVRERGEAHPRDVDAHFSHGTVENYWGGSSNATTHLLDAMHYRGLLRVARRESGIRIYAAHRHEPAPAAAAERRARVDALVDVAVRLYAPLPGRSLSYLVRRLRFAVPQWRQELTAALQRARERLAQARVAGIDWYWPVEEDPSAGALPPPGVRLLTPFDPIVRDRDRFELLWGWVYRFEAYTPAPKRKLGYYALPVLRGHRVIGWGNLSLKVGKLEAAFEYTGTAPRSRDFKRELEGELSSMRVFLGLPP
ncbi:MAG: crosslink repair DNA glycosylase YcaQ family protein [Acidobacteriota bacterium]